VFDKIVIDDDEIEEEDPPTKFVECDSENDVVIAGDEIHVL